MILFFIILAVSRDGREITDATAIAIEHGMYLYENDKISSNSIAVLNYFDNLEELLNKLKLKFDKVKVGSQIDVRFILSRFPKKDNFTAIYEPPVFRNISMLALKIVGFYIICIALYKYLSRLEKYMAKKIQYRNNPFNVTIIFKNSNQIPMDLQRTIPFKFEKMMFVNPTVQRGSISIDDNNIEIFVTIPISNWAAIACNLIIPNSDIRFYEPIFVGNGELEADDSMNRCKIPIYAENPTQFRIKLPGHDLICYAPNCCLPKMFVCTRCYDYVMMNFILDISVLSRNLEGITGLIKSLYWKLDYNGLGFFCSVSSKIETVEFISDDPKLKQIVLDILPKIEQHKNPENGVKIHLNGIEIMGFLYEIGRSKYYFVCILKNQHFQFVERGFSVICAYIAMIFHIYVTHSEDSLMIERIDKIISANTKATYLEFVGQTAYSTNSLVEFKGKKIDITDELKEVIQNIEGEKIVELQSGEIYKIITKVMFDEVMVNWVRIALLQEYSKEKNIIDEYEKVKRDWEVASKYYSFHQTINETTVSDDSLSIELGYHNGSCNLLDFVNPDEIPYLQEINKKPLIFHLMTSNGSTKWYTSFPYQDNQGKNRSLVFSVYDLTVLQGLNTVELQSTLLNAAEDYFACYLIDSTSSEVLESISHPRLWAKSWANIVEKADPSSRFNLHQIYLKVQQKLTDSDKFLGKHTVLKGGYDWCDYKFHRTSDRTILVILLRVNEEIHAKEYLLEMKSLFSFALYHSNVIRWDFNSDSTDEKIIITKPQNFEHVELNWNTIFTNFSSDSINIVKEKFERSLLTGESFEVEVSLIFDKMRWILFRGTRCDKNKLCGVYFDLTELRENEILLEMKRKQILDATNAKTMFLANMTHEIRTPLNGMFSLLELLMGTTMSKEQTEMMNVVKTSFTKLLDVLNDTLDLAKIDQGKMTPSSIVFSPLEIIEPIVSDMAKIAKSEVTMNLECPATFPILVYGDPHFMMRIVYNLMTNAVKFTSYGSITVRLNYDDDKIIVSVSDTGIGIPEDNRSKIFETFTQVDSSIMRSYGGSGIGLALVKKLVNLINGSVDLESTVGIGSEFTIEFPYKYVYYPYFPRIWHNKPGDLLVLDKTIENEVAFLEYKEFFGYKSIHNTNEIVPEHLKYIIVDHSPEQLKIGQELKSKYQGTQVIVCKKPATDVSTIPDDFYITSYPKKPTAIRKMLMYGKVGQKAKEKKPHPKVLVADDNDMNRTVIDKILTKIECPHKIVSDGSEILNALKEEHFDIVLLDQYMPIMSGPDACRQVRSSGEDFSSIPIIAMTASSTDEDKNECLNSGMNDFVTKPVTIAKLHKLLRRYHN